MAERRSSFEYEDLLACARGELFGAGNAQLPLPPMLMFERISTISEDGGAHGKGQVKAEMAVAGNPLCDWFFSCHFYQDPVMPGSLGVEAILQAMQLYALQQNLGGHLKSPYFTHRANHKIAWMYRGQIIPDNERMYLEIHISNVDVSDTQVTLTGDASLWKDTMRIYEVKDIAMSILEF